MRNDVDDVKPRPHFQVCHVIIIILVSNTDVGEQFCTEDSVAGGVGHGAAIAEGPIGVITT